MSVLPLTAMSIYRCRLASLRKEGVAGIWTVAGFQAVWGSGFELDEREGEGEEEGRGEKGSEGRWFFSPFFFQSVHLSATTVSDLVIDPALLTFPSRVLPSIHGRVTELT